MLVAVLRVHPEMFGCTEYLKIQSASIHGFSFRHSPNQLISSHHFPALQNSSRGFNCDVLWAVRASVGGGEPGSGRSKGTENHCDDVKACERELGCAVVESGIERSKSFLRVSELGRS